MIVSKVPIEIPPTSSAVQRRHSSSRTELCGPGTHTDMTTTSNQRPVTTSDSGKSSGSLRAPKKN